MPTCGWQAALVKPEHLFDDRSSLRRQFLYRLRHRLAANRIRDAWHGRNDEGLEPFWATGRKTDLTLCLYAGSDYT
eukprot:scaffold2209_cov168-Amphora_coffeaeformis.AAC.3